MSGVMVVPRCHKIEVSCPNRAACDELSKHSETRNSMGKSRHRTPAGRSQVGSARAGR